MKIIELEQKSLTFYEIITALTPKSDKNTRKLQILIFMNIDKKILNKLLAN